MEEVGEVQEGGRGGDSRKGKSEQKITNQFNFSERASQTLNNPLKASQRASPSGGMGELLQRSVQDGLESVVI